MFGKPGRVLRVFYNVAQHPLSKGRRFRSMFRWGRSLVAIHLSPTRQIAIPYVGGAVLHWPAKATSVALCARYGLGEYADMAFCLHMLRPEDMLCDVGANAGVYTVLAGRAVGCRVVAMEPVPRTFNLLMQNVWANSLSDRVESHRIGVGRSPGAFHITDSLWSYNHIVDGPGEHTVEVQILPLDDVLAGRVPTLIKIDVEGFEGEVVAGAAATLSSADLQAVIIEMTGHVGRYGGSLDDIQKQLEGHGLKGPYWYDPENRQLVSAGTPGKRKYNQIFVRDPSFVADRVANAPWFPVHGAMV